MSSNKPLKGAAAITHRLKEYGHGHMEQGLKRLARESQKKGFQQGVQYTLNNLSFIERLLGHQFKK